MKTYCVGDIHGCFTEFAELLDSVGFNENEDFLLATGDIIGRGPYPIETLRFFLRNRSRIVTVLGNHELSLLRNYSIWRSISDPKNRSEFLKNLKAGELKLILKEKNSEEIFDYLRSRPLAYYDRERKILLTHAGLSPEWKPEDAVGYSRELETVLQSDRFDWFMSNMFSDKPDSWSKVQKKEAKARKAEKVIGKDPDAAIGKISVTIELKRLIYIVNAFTRMRFCRSDMSLEFLCKDGPEAAKLNNLYPWYELQKNISDEERLIFGHWAALQGKCPNRNIIAMDTGCVWNGSLTLIDIDNPYIKHIAQAHH